MLNPMEAQHFIEERINEAHAFVARERLAQELVAGQVSPRTSWKRRIGRWLIRLGQRWAPTAQTPDTPSGSAQSRCAESPLCC